MPSTRKPKAEQIPFPKLDHPDVLRKGRRHLGRCDPVLRQLMKDVGPCTLACSGDHFLLLVRSIVSQQISGKAAASIFARLEGLSAPKPLTARAVLGLSEEQRRGAGLSSAKSRSLLDLADHIDSGRLDLAGLPHLPDEEVIAQLVPVRGIGRWTAQMFLMFGLGRTDVWPIADLGLRTGVQRRYDLAEPPDAEHLETLAEPWRPYRSLATWYFWRGLGDVPQSKPPATRPNAGSGTV